MGKYYVIKAPDGCETIIVKGRMKALGDVVELDEAVAKTLLDEKRIAPQKTEPDKTKPTAERKGGKEGGDRR